MTSETELKTENLEAVRTKYGVAFVLYALATFALIMVIAGVWATSLFLGVMILLVALWMGLNGIITLLFVFNPALPAKLIAYSERNK